MAKALVVYATITGNNEDVADMVTGALEDLGVDVEMTEMTMADVADFDDVDLCVVCPYTYDEGSLPDEGLDFFDDLKEADLAGKVYGVAGSGDTFYGDDYCKAVDEFGAAFEQAGATKGSENVHINLAPDAEDEERLASFAKDLVAKLGQEAVMRKLWNKYGQVIAYLFWGVVTTLVNIVSFQFLSSGVHWNYQVANVTAWFLSVLVAYLTNKVWVFNSHYTSWKAFWIEISQFFFYRGLTLLIDMAFMFVGVTLLKLNTPIQELMVKIVDNVVVVVANYIFSRWLIFKDNEKIAKR